MSNFFAKMSAGVALLSLTMGVAEASSRTADNIWWKTVRNYQGSGETVCLAKNLNFSTVTALFDIYPAGFTPGHRLGHATALIVLPPYRRLLLVGWLRAERTHSPSCVLRSWRY